MFQIYSNHSVNLSSDSLSVLIELDDVIIVCPEVLNSFVLIIGLFQMYHGVDIAHPVFKARCEIRFSITLLN
jgi:hypothetical protein